MPSILPNEISGKIFPIYDIQDIKSALNSEQFSEMIPMILDFLDPHEELKSAQKKSKKHKKRRIAQKASFKAVKEINDFYTCLNDSQVEEILNYLFINHHEARLVNLFHSVAPEVQVKIIENMLDLAFKANLISYSKEVVNIRRKIAKGYVRSAENMNMALQSAISGNSIKAVLYLNENTNQIGEFIKYFQSDPNVMNSILREVMKWVPRGEYLAH